MQDIKIEKESLTVKIRSKVYRGKIKAKNKTKNQKGDYELAT